MTHAYQADPQAPPDHRGGVPCTCGLPRANRAHQLPAQDPAVTEAERRRTGERE